MQLTLLQPGVTPNEGLNTVNKGLQGGSDISVSGGSTTSNLWLVDGADNVDHGSNRTILVYPSVDAIEEFKIQRNNYGAEFGQAGGAQVNLVTKSGTNTYHGTGVLLHAPRLAELDQLLPGAGGPGRGAPQVGRLRGDVRRPHPQGQAPLLPLLREEQRHAQLRSQRVRPDGSRARRATSAAPVSPAARRRSRTTPSPASPSPATGSRPIGSIRPASRS